MKLLYTYFMQALRTLAKYRSQTAISVVGLAFGLVCLTFSVNWFWYETHYDNFRPDYRNIYVVKSPNSFSSSTIYRSANSMNTGETGDSIQLFMWTFQLVSACSASGRTRVMAGGTNPANPLNTGVMPRLLMRSRILCCRATCSKWFL